MAKKDKPKNGNGKNALAAPATGTAVAEAGDAGFEAHAGHGMETVGAADLLIPRIVIAQKLSPQLNKKEPQFIKGASEGDICDTALGVNFDRVDFIPIVYSKKWIEWAPRKSKRGIIAVHDTPEILADCTPDDKGVPVHGENRVLETAQFFGFRCQEGDIHQAFIAMTGTQLKKARRWLSIASAIKLKRQDGSRFTAPLWYCTYVLDGSSEESNDEGSWRGWTIERGDNISDYTARHSINFTELRSDILAFAEAVSSETVKNFTPDDKTAGEEVPI